MRVLEVTTPHTYSWVQDSNVSRQVIEYLTKTGQDNITRPYLAESWSASDDLKTWTLTMRDVKWHNGRQFTAEDAAWNIRHALDEATGSSVLGLMKGYMLNEVDGKTELWDANAIEVTDDRTLRLNLKEPQVAVPEHLFHYPMLIVDPEEGGSFGVGSNGTGPFELVEHAMGPIWTSCSSSTWATTPRLPSARWRLNRSTASTRATSVSSTSSRPCRT
jgi:peptide/nickel transport system substrate-binding protein